MEESEQRRWRNVRGGLARPDAARDALLCRVSDALASNARESTRLANRALRNDIVGSTPCRLVSSVSLAAAPSNPHGLPHNTLDIWLQLRGHVAAGFGAARQEWTLSRDVGLTGAQVSSATEPLDASIPPPPMVRVGGYLQSVTPETDHYSVRRRCQVYLRTFG